MVQVTESRQNDRANFLQSYFVDGTHSITPLQSDAGLRSYFRIKTAKSNSFILMDCPTSYCAIEPFVDIARHLKSHGFTAPGILHFNNDQGFIILEDFGDQSVKHFLFGSAANSRNAVYRHIMDILILLQEKPPPADLKKYSNELLLSEVSLFIEWYIPHALQRDLTIAAASEHKEIWQEILTFQVPFDSTLVLRDYHAENIMYMPDRQGMAAFGLLDFQDALTGSPIYDLVSVLEDARIPVTRALALSCIKYFAGQKNMNLAEVLTNYHILGAQRNSRILGVFARKLIRDKNDNYLKYIPLVLKYLDYDLSHPALKKLKKWHRKYL